MAGELKQIWQVTPQPAVEPEEIDITFPCFGGARDAFKVVVKNYSHERMTFMVNCTKQDVISIMPKWGFCERASTKDIEFQPLPMMLPLFWNHKDHVEVCMKVAPTGDLWRAKELWTNPEATMYRSFKVKLTPRIKKK